MSRALLITFLLPFAAFLLGLPLSQRLSRSLSRGFGWLNLAAVLAFVFAAQTEPWTCTGLRLFGAPSPLALDGLGELFLVVLKSATLVALYTPVHRLDRTFLACVWGADFALSGAVLSADAFGYLFFSSLSLIPTTLGIAVWGRNEWVQVARPFFISQVLGTLALSVPVMAFAAVHQEQFGLLSGFPGNLARATVPHRTTLLALALGGSALRLGIFPGHLWFGGTLSQAPLAMRLFVVGGILPVAALGLFRVVVPLFESEILAHQGTLVSLTVLSALFSALIAWRKNDVLEGLAYALGAHCGLILLGALFGTPETWAASFYHGAAVFLSALGFLVLAERAALQRGGSQLSRWNALARPFSCFGLLLLLFLAAPLLAPGLAGFPGAFVLLSETLNGNSLGALAVTLALFSLAGASGRVLGTALAAQPKEPLSISPLWAARFLPVALVLVGLGLFPGPGFRMAQKVLRPHWSRLSTGSRFELRVEQGTTSLRRSFHEHSSEEEPHD